VKKIRVSLIFLIIFTIHSSGQLEFDNLAHAGNFGFGTHGGYGYFKYEERSSAFGPEQKAKSQQDAFIFGVSGEYSFPKPENFYAGITTDWLFGLKDRETWKEDGVRFQINDIKVFGQWYDFRFGYKNSIDNLYYRLYVSGGWDGIHFKRSNLFERGVARAGTVTKDFSLWRTGGGISLGYKIGKWALDSRASYAYFPFVEIDDSSLPEFTFDTNGTCLDAGLGIARMITKNMGFYAGVSYTLLTLDESDVMQRGSIKAVSPESEIEILLGVVNLTYAF